MTFRRPITVFSAAILAALLFPSGAAASAPVRVSLKGEAAVTGPAVYLADVAADCGDAGLAGVKLFASPSWGQSRTVTRGEILKRLARVTRRRVLLAGSEEVVVSRPGGDRSREVRSLLESGIASSVEGVDGLSWELLFPERPLWLPWGGLTVDFDAPGRPGGARVLRCQIRVDGKSVRSLSVTCRFTRTLSVPVVTRRLTRGDTLRAGDVSWEARSYDRRVPDIVSAGALAGGLRVKRVIRPGDVVTDTAVEPHPVVRPGQVIDLVIRRSALRITTRARALQKGWIGSRIRLQKLTDNSYVYGRVSRKGVAVYE